MGAGIPGVGLDFLAAVGQGLLALLLPQQGQGLIAGVRGQQPARLGVVREGFPGLAPLQVEPGPFFPGLR